jgi:hypothetical protein
MALEIVLAREEPRIRASIYLTKIGSSSIMGSFDMAKNTFAVYERLTTAIGKAAFARI